MDTPRNNNNQRSVVIIKMLKKLRLQEFFLLTTQSFVDPISHEQTNTIESSCSVLKRSFTRTGRLMELFHGYLAKYIFKHHCRIKGIDKLEEFSKWQPACTILMEIILLESLKYLIIMNEIER